MQKFVKRVQSRVAYSGISANMNQCREAYQAVLPESAWESPSDEQLAQVVEYVKKSQQNDIHLEPASLTITEPEVSGDLLEPIPQPEIVKIPVEDMPALQPPTQHSALSTSSSEESAIASPIPSAQISDLVGDVFKNQPIALKEQLTDYAMQQAFGDVRQVQEFLEQLRSMEFDLMVQSLHDHVNRRGSMQALLNGMIKGQKQQDQEGKTDFFNRSQQNLTNFREEMMSRLAKQSLYFLQN
jgi:hypothetical protein